MKSAIGLLSKLSIITLVMAFSVNSYASSNDVHEGLTCDAKKQAIEAKIEQAKKANNTFEITGLEKALQQVNTNCSDDTLEQKYKRLVEEKSKNVSDKTKEYEKDGINANQDKIDALKSKLHDAEKELTEAKNKLADYYDKVNTK